MVPCGAEPRPEAARALREEASHNEAEFLADEARIDHLQLAYRTAAAKYAEAPPSWRHSTAQASGSF